MKKLIKILVLVLVLQPLLLAANINIAQAQDAEDYAYDVGGAIDTEAADNDEGEVNTEPAAVPPAELSVIFPDRMELPPEAKTPEVVKKVVAHKEDYYNVLSIFLEGRARLAINAVDLTILKSHVAPEQLAQVVSSVGTADRQTMDTVIQYAFGNTEQLKAIIELPAQRANFIKELENAKKVKDLPAGTVEILEAIITAAKKNDGLAVVNKFTELKTKITTKNGEFWQFTAPGMAQFVARAVLPIDQRVVDALVYLVTPTERGGAGHERLKVKRIWRDYTTEKKSVSKETENATNISAHWLGQAIDISEIDLIKCTLLKKRRLGKDKKTKHSAIPIKVAWQSEEGIVKAGGIEAPMSLNEYIKMTMEESMLDLLSELDVDNIENLEVDRLKLGDVIGYIGRSMAEQIFDAPSHSLQGYDLGDTLDKLGRAVLADTLKLPRESWQGGTIEEVEENLGRLMIEEKLQLPTESLVGVAPAEIITSVGRRYLEYQLGLPVNILPITNVSREQLEGLIGQGVIEKRLNIKKDGFREDDLGKIKTTIGQERFKIIFSRFADIDEQLDLEYGVTKDFYEGRLSPAEFKRRAGAKIIEQKILVYRDYQVQSPQEMQERVMKAAMTGGMTDTGPQNPAEQAAANSQITGSPADQAFGLPLGTIKRFLAGDGAIYSAVGQDILAKKLFIANKDRLGLVGWLAGANSETVDFNSINNKLSLAPTDFEQIFRLGNGQKVFRQLGKKRLLKAIRQSNIYQKEESEAKTKLYAEYPELYEIEQRVEFTGSKIDDINQRLDRLERLSQRPEVRFSAGTIRNELVILKSRPSIETLKSAARSIGAEINKIETTTQGEVSKEQIKTELAAIYEDMQEIIEGEEVSDFGGSADQDARAKSLGLSTSDWLAILGGKMKVTSAVKKIGGRKLEGMLNLPQGAVTYMIAGERSDISADGFYAGIGASTIEAVLDLPAGSMAGRDIAKVVAIAGAENIDRGFGLPQGTASKLAAQPPPIDLQIKEEYQDRPLPATAANRVSQINGYTLPDSQLIDVGNGLSIGQKYNQPRPPTLYETPPPAVKYEQWSQLETNRQRELGEAASLSQQLATSIDRLLKIKTPLTHQFLIGLLPPRQYAVAVGRQAAKESAVSTLVKEIGGGDLWSQYHLGANDIYNMFSGQGTVVFQRLGGWQMDSRLKLPRGTGEKLIAAGNTDERQKVMAEAGGRMIGDIIGLGSVKLEGNIKDNIGQSRVETILGLVPETFKRDYGLGQIITFNTPEVFSRAFNFELEKAIIPPSILPRPGSWLESTQAAEASNPVAARQLATLLDRLKKPTDKDSANWQKIDDLLHIEKNTTKRLLAQEITPADYLDKIGSWILREQLAKPEVLDNVAETLGYDTSDAGWQQTKNKLSGLTGIYNTLDRNDGKLEPNQWAQVYDSFGQIWHYDLDDKAGVRHGFFRDLIANPKNMEWLAMDEGVRQLGEKWGLVQNGHNYLQEAFNIYQQGGQDGLSSFAVRTAQLSVGRYLQQRIREDYKVAMPFEDSFALAGGDMRVASWMGAAAMVNRINYDKDNPLPAEFQVTYQDVKYALSQELTDGEKSEVEGIRTETRQNFDTTAFVGDNSAAAAKASFIAIESGDLAAQQRISELKQAKRKSAEYKFYDSQLWKVDNNVTTGTARAFLDKESTGRDRANAVFGWFGNKVHDQNANIPAEVVTNFARYANNEIPLDDLASMQVVYNFGDQEFSRIFDLNLPAGFTGGLFVAAKNNWDFNAKDAKINNGQSFNQIGQAWLQDQAFVFVDKKLGWGLGLTKQIYDKATIFEGARKAYAAAKGALTAAKGAEAVEQATKTITAAKAKLAQAKAEIVSFVVTQIFGEQLAKIDQKLGLVPGSMALLVGMAITAAMGAHMATMQIAGAAVPIALIIFILLNLFGTYKVLLTCTADGYYPYLESPNPNAGTYLGLGSVDGMNTSAYRAYVLKAAQAKTRDLIDDMYNFGQKKRNNLPNQIMTFRQEDVDSFVNRSQKSYGRLPSEDYRRGLWQNNLMWDQVHIGF